MALHDNGKWQLAIAKQLATLHICTTYKTNTAPLNLKPQPPAPISTSGGVVGSGFRFLPICNCEGVVVAYSESSGLQFAVAEYWNLELKLNAAGKRRSYRQHVNYRALCNFILWSESLGYTYYGVYL
jgi:hypothetical protein